MEITALGDSALIVRVADNFEAAPDAALDAVLRARDAIRAAGIPELTDIAPAYETVAAFFDPVRLSSAGGSVKSLTQRLIEAVQSAGAGGNRVTRRTIDVPVCYDAEFALDLDVVAAQAGISREEVVRRHSGATYRVSCVGFSPGFPYLSGLPRELATPRRATPRTRVPAGSVAIGSAQTGVYPHESPGGWNVIGRTPFRLFDPNETPPALLQAGDEVRFRPISRKEFLQEAQ
jgi:KipI family sensor histidine kinase inhibitor